MDNCLQRICVTAKRGSSRAKIIREERREPTAPWQTVAVCDGWVGENGICENRHTGDLTTPIGHFPLGICFGCEPKPHGLQMPWRTVTEHSHWVGDPRSPHFNTWQEWDEASQWDASHGERLADYPEEYAMACVIGFNQPPNTVPSAGFAIFLHCSDRPTAGCVGMAKEEMLRMLQWLRPEKNPHIYICKA